MNWQYSQSTGEMTGAQAMQGYSGAGEGKNNPLMQNVHDVGPLPRGLYTFGSSFECSMALQPSEVCPDCSGVGIHRHGPNVIRLIPDPTNEMEGRDGFLIHGDNETHTASEGCIVLPPQDRLIILKSQLPIEVVQ